MIRPTSRTLNASIGSMIPRVLVQSEVAPNGDSVEILFPRHKDPLITRFFAPRMTKWKRFERFPLDARGSRIWCLINNERCVDELVAEYQKFYPDDGHQVDRRIHCYIKKLADHGFLEIVMA